LSLGKFLTLQYNSALRQLYAPELICIWCDLQRCIPGRGVDAMFRVPHRNLRTIGEAGNPGNPGNAGNAGNAGNTHKNYAQLHRISKVLHNAPACAKHRYTDARMIPNCQNRAGKRLDHLLSADFNSNFIKKICAAPSLFQPRRRAASLQPVLHSPILSLKSTQAVTLADSAIACVACR
jgi:hypothetical protein